MVGCSQVLAAGWVTIVALDDRSKIARVARFYLTRSQVNSGARLSTVPPRKIDSYTRRTTLRGHFAKTPRSASLARRASKAIASVGPSTTRTGRSQITFRRRRGFAWVWAPQQYLGKNAAPLVITLAVPHRIRSRRWKEVVTPRPGWYVHHLEIRRVSDIDQQLRRWLRLAWEAAA